MQQKIATLGVGESQSFFQTINTETPNKIKNIPTKISQKIKTSSNQIQKIDSQNNSGNLNYPKNFNEENINSVISTIQLNKNINISSDNDNNNNQFHSGRWTEEEHQKFIDGILEYGNEWKKVQQIIKTRSSTQARSHAQKFFLRVKKIIKNNGGNFNINEKDKIFENIINTILPNKKGESLTKSQKEKLLSAVSSNIKYEAESNELSEEGLQPGLEEDNLKYKNENDTIFKYHKMSCEIGNTNNNIFTKRKISLGQKRKLSRTDSRDKIFIIQKDISHKPSLDLSIQNNNKNENNENKNQININNNSNLNENEIYLENKGFELNKKNIISNTNSTGIINNNTNLNFDNYENKNNVNGFIINNYINVTNNYMNICNVCNNDINNNSNNYNYNYNNLQDFYNYNYDKNDSINNERNFNFYGFPQCPDKNICNYSEKPFSFGNQFKKDYCNTYNFFNNKINVYNENENLNNASNPFDINFNNFNNENYNNNENEQQLTIRDDEFIKINNNNEDNIDL